MSSPLKQNTATIQNLLNTINSLPEAGTDLPELTNEGSASDLLSGKQLIDQDGNVVTGTIPTKTASNLTASGATVTVPAGYYASQATKSVATATQATPSITINASGLITATATQTAGYVAAGSKSATKQLAFQPAKTITPTTANQTAVSSGYYTGGNITVKGDSNLVAGNIKSGVSIFGVTGTYAGSGSGGDTSAEDGIITKTISGAYVNDRVTSIGSSAFYNCSSLTTINFPAATTIGNSAFTYCYSLTTVSFPVATTIGRNAFYNCSSLTTINFPAATTIGNSAFFSCSRLTTVSFPVATTIGNSAFLGCGSLTTVSFPKVTSIGNSPFRDCSSLTTASFPEAKSIGLSAFLGCGSLTTVSFPVATTIDISAFCDCSSLTTASFPKAKSIDSNAFYSCYNLKSLYLTGSSLCKLSNSNAFTLTPIGGYSTSAGTYGSIYVPASLLTAYQTATNWTYFSSRFVGI